MAGELGREPPLDLAETVVRAPGDGTAKPGSTEPLKQGDPNQTRATVGRFPEQSYILSTFDPVAAPAEASWFYLIVDRTSILGSTDPYAVQMEIEFSIDGGVTWGVEALDVSGKPVVGYTMFLGMTTGGEIAPPGMSNDAVRGATLPPDFGVGRMVRFGVGAKEPLDLGVKVKFS